MSRRRFSEREVLECLVRQGAIIPCRKCRVSFSVEDAKSAEREHVHEVALGGPDTVENCAFSHRDCHAVITNGNGATTAGSSKNRIAKTHPNRAEKFKVVKKPLDADLVSEPSDRCRICGECLEACTCPPRQARSSFGRRR